MKKRIAILAVLIGTSAVGFGQQGTPPSRDAIVGQSLTQLTDGRWLVIGGMASGQAIHEIAIVDVPQSANRAARVEGRLHDARAWHSATVLPDGRVLIVGGLGADRKTVSTAEVFDPLNGTLQLVPWFGGARAHHSATLLRDGRVLITGGMTEASSNGSVETFDPTTFEVRTLEGALLRQRSGHSATLLPDGTVRLDGGDLPQQQSTSTEVYNPDLQVSSSVDQFEPDSTVAGLAFVSPLNGSEVIADARVVVQFTKPVNIQSLNDGLVRLQAQNGSQAKTRTVLAEGGRLLFVVPEDPLLPGERYQAVVRGLADNTGARLPDVSLTFRVKPEEKAASEPDEEWVPPLSRRWRTDRERSPWESLAPLRAAAGVTAVSGRVLMLNGLPLADVTLKIGERTAYTDRTGRFLITDVDAGAQTIVIDGRSVKRPGRTYGVFHALTRRRRRRRSCLNTIWMTPIDTAHAIPIGSPVTTDLVLTTPLIPGLEVHIPKGAVIRDHDGRPVNQVSITPIPVDRPPFPLPSGIEVPVYFTIQPGGGFIESSNNPWPSGARVVYPNFTGEQPGTEFQFWNYDPEDRGWHVYGQGVVSPTGAQVVPRPGVVIYRFTGTMIDVPGMTPPPYGPEPDTPDGGDPVDLATGLFVLEKTDLFLTDVMPLSLKRTYRHDTSSRPRTLVAFTRAFEQSGRKVPN